MFEDTSFEIPLCSWNDNVTLCAFPKIKWSLNLLLAGLALLVPLDECFRCPWGKGQAFSQRPAFACYYDKDSCQYANHDECEKYPHKITFGLILLHLFS